jgi:hypothetical protein
MPFAPYAELSDSQARQYLNAERVFLQLQQALRDAKQLRGGMFWRSMASGEYLIRTSPSGAQKSLGRRSEQTEAMFASFTTRRAASDSRVRGLRESLDEQRRLNRALRVGHAPTVVVRILRALEEAGLSEHFRAVGTHALYAYEAAAGVLFDEARLATRDVDLFYDAGRHMAFLAVLQRQQTTLTQVLRKADPTFSVLPDKRETAANKDGFEVDFIRRPTRPGDPHPMPLADPEHLDEDSAWAVQVPSGGVVESAGRFGAMIVAANGEMAWMETVPPTAFVRIKQRIAADPGRDPIKKRKDLAQAQVIQQLLEDGLLIDRAPRLLSGHDGDSPLEREAARLAPGRGG